MGTVWGIGAGEFGPYMTELNYNTAMQRRILIADPRVERLNSCSALLKAAGFQVIEVQDVTADATGHALWPPDVVVIAPGLKQTTGFLKQLVDPTPFISQPETLESLPSLIGQYLVLPSQTLTFGRRTVIFDRLIARTPTGDVKLTTIEADLLAYLSMHPGRAIHRSQLLQRVWGYNSKVASRAVDSTVKRLRKKIEEDPANPLHLITVFGVGYRLVEFSEEGTPAPPPETVIDSASASLLLGRETEMAGITRAFSLGKKWVTIRGFGGVGKTALARKWAETNEPNRYWFVDLNHARTRADILHALAQVLKLSDLSEEDGSETLRAALRALNGGVVVLDNCEQVRMEICQTLGELQRDNGFKWLVTSREPLGLAGEHVIPLGSLAPLTANQLFHERVEALGFLPVPVADQSRVNDIVAALDYLPLAIERAAAQMGVLSVPKLLERLQFDPPEWVDSDRPERQQTLRATLQWSWDLLAEDERQVLAQCSVFVGGFTLTLAESVLQVSSSRPVSQVLASLMRRSLLFSLSPGRMALLNLTTEFAGWKLKEMGLAAATYQKHAEAMVRYGVALRSHFLFSTWQPGASMLVEHQNFLAAFERVDDLTLRFELYLSLDWIYGRVGPASQRAPLMESLGPIQQYRPAQRTHLWIRKAGGALRSQDPEMYDTYLDAAFSDAVETRSPSVIRSVLMECLESNRACRRDPTRWLERFGEYSDDSDEDRGLCFFYQGVAAHETNQREDAIELYSLASTTISGELNPYYAAVSAYRHGFLLFESGQIESAERAFFRCLSIIEPRDEDTANGLQSLLALTSLARGEYALALEMLERSLKWAKEFGNLRHSYEDLFLKGICLQLQGSFEAARSSYRESLQGRQHLSQGFDVQVTMAFLGTAEACLGASLEARRWIARALERERCPEEEAQIIACCAEMIRFVCSRTPSAKTDAETWLERHVDTLPYARLGWAVQLFRAALER